VSQANIQTLRHHNWHGYREKERERECESERENDQYRYIRSHRLRNNHTCLCCTWTTSISTRTLICQADSVVMCISTSSCTSSSCVYLITRRRLRFTLVNVLMWVRLCCITLLEEQILFSKGSFERRPGALSSLLTVSCTTKKNAEHNRKINMSQSNRHLCDTRSDRLDDLDHVIHMYIYTYLHYYINMCVYTTYPHICIYVYT